MRRGERRGLHEGAAACWVGSCTRVLVGVLT